MRTKSAKILAIWGTLAIIGSQSMESIHSAYARDYDDEDEREESRDDDEDERPRTPIAPVVTPPVQTPAPAPVPGTTRSCTTAYDTVTNASGTQSQVPRQVCTDVPSSTLPQTTPPAPVAAPVTKPVEKPAPVPAVKPFVINALKDGVFTGVWTYSFPGSGINYVVEITISGGKITKAGFLNFTPSGNGLYSRAKGDAELKGIVATQNASVDVVTGASGTSNAIQNAVNQALTKARWEAVVQIPKPVVQPAVEQVAKPVLVNAPATDAYLGRSAKYVAPNGKTYVVFPDASRWGKFSFKRADGSVSDKTFATRDATVIFLKANNPSSVKTAFVQTAVNDVAVIETLTVANAEPRTGKKRKSVRATGKTRQEAIGEARKEADARTVAKATGKKPQKPITAAAPIKKASVPVKTAPAPAPVKVAVVPKPVTKPVQTPVPVGAPAVDTTTKAS